MQLLKSIVLVLLTTFITIVECQAQFVCVQENYSDCETGADCTIPQMTCPAETVICLDETTLAPVLSVQPGADIPNIEYAVIDYSTIAASGNGPLVVGIDKDGVFKPSDFNLTPGSSFGIIPVAYNLADIQETVDDLLTGTVLFLGPCCDLAVNLAGVALCDTLNAAGIFAGADITGLEDATSLFGNSSSNQSICDLANEIDSLNITISDPIVPTACGGGDRINFAYGAACNYYIVPDVLFLNTTHAVDEIFEASKSIESSSVIKSPAVVNYHAGVFIDLTAGFETLIGSDFTATIIDPCQ